MAKICLCPGCNNPRFSGGYCRKLAHQKLRTDEKYLKQQAAIAKKKKEKPPKPIPKESPHQKKRNRQYSKDLPGWKEANPFCAFPGCKKPTDDCHHIIGRGIHTNNKSKMIPLCRPHHDLCKDQPKLAMDIGLIETRTISRKRKLYEE